jgi:hypothetical protein
VSVLCSRGGWLGWPAAHGAEFDAAVSLLALILLLFAPFAALDEGADGQRCHYLTKLLHDPFRSVISRPEAPL